MANQKIVSKSVLIAKANTDKIVKTETVRIIETDPDILASQKIQSTILINGKFAKAGDLIEVLADEAADLIRRGRAELAAA